MGYRFYFHFDGRNMKYDRNAKIAKLPIVILSEASRLFSETLFKTVFIFFEPQVADCIIEIRGEPQNRRILNLTYSLAYV